MFWPASPPSKEAARSSRPPSGTHRNWHPWPERLSDHLVVLGNGRPLEKPWSHGARTDRKYDEVLSLFDIGADLPFTVNYLPKTVSKAMGLSHHVRHLPPRNEVTLAFSDHQKAECIFGSHVKKSLDEGIKLMAAWVNANGAQKSSVFRNIEILKHLPPSWREAMENRQRSSFWFCRAPGR